MKKTLSLILLMAILGAGCGGRIPSDAKTSRLAKGYFHKYGKKYKDATFRDKAVQSVEVKGTRELQKNVATSLLVLSLKDSTQLPVIITMLRKRPMGWRITGWEKAQN
jgi:hypothetical protein